MGASQQALLVASTSAVAGALDAFTANLWAAYGITRQLGTAIYSGSAIRVRKSTGGDTTTEQDIGFVGTALDTSALATFAGSETVVVTKLYDQSGNGRDAVQATGAAQPRIVNAGVYDGFVVFDGSDDTLVTSATTGTGTVFSTSGKVTYRALTPTSIAYLIGVNGAGQSLAQVYLAGGNDVNVYATSNSSGTATDQDRIYPVVPVTHVWGYVHNLGGGTAVLVCRLYEDGVEQSTATQGGIASGNYAANTLKLGSDGSTFFCPENIYSFAVWESNQNANMVSIAAAMA